MTHSFRSPAVGGVVGLVMALTLVSCSNGDGAGNSGVALSAAGMSAAPASAPREDDAAAAVVADTITPALIARGKRVYEGDGGAICMTCHGQGAKGVKGLGPDLTDGKWLHGDGSFEFLKKIVKEGVMKPKESQSVMPPYGGVPFDDQRLAAVAAYIYSLNEQPGGG